MTRIPRGAVQLKWRRRRQEKSRRWPTLNLVALMDVFTILVLFFLVHSGDGGREAHSQLVRLPESVANQPPRNTPVVMVTGDSILLEGEPVVAVATAMRASGDGIEELHRALKAQLVPPAGQEVAGELTIMGDRNIPFELLHRVMQTCTRAGYGEISLSVLQRTIGAG